MSTEPQSFVDLIHAYGEARPPALPYREGEDMAAWQARFRAKLEELRSDVPARVPADYVLNEDGHILLWPPAEAFFRQCMIQ